MCPYVVEFQCCTNYWLFVGGIMYLLKITEMHSPFKIKLNIWPICICKNYIFLYLLHLNGPCNLESGLESSKKLAEMCFPVKITPTRGIQLVPMLFVKNNIFAYLTSNLLYSPWRWPWIIKHTQKKVLFVFVFDKHHIFDLEFWP